MVKVVENYDSQKRGWAARPALDWQHCLQMNALMPGSWCLAKWSMVYLAFVSLLTIGLGLNTMLLHFGLPSTDFVQSLSLNLQNFVVRLVVTFFAPLVPAPLGSSSSILLGRQCLGIPAERPAYIIGLQQWELLQSHCLLFSWPQHLTPFFPKTFGVAIAGEGVVALQWISWCAFARVSCILCCKEEQAVQRHCRLLSWC